MFKFKKIASVLASTSLITSTIALGAAASFPTPFVKNGAADVAIVYGSNAPGGADLLAATRINSELTSELASQTATGGSTSSDDIAGEAYPLFTSSTKIYLNDSINKARTTVTESNLPNVLADGTFQGTVTATYDQRIDIGTGIRTDTNNRLVFGQHPTSDDDPIMAIDLGTTSAAHVYNLSVVFNKAPNFTHSDSQGEDLNLFGQTYTVSSATDNSNLVLLKSSQKVALTSDDPSAEVSVEGVIYTVELVSASDTAATVKVTDSSGSSSTKEINEDTSKTVQGLEVGVSTADETNLQLSATVTVGANRIKLSDNSAVKIGSEETTLDGTNVRFLNGDTLLASTFNLTKIIFQEAAEDTDTDALFPGQDFVDPTFGSVKLSHAGFNIGEDSSARENIEIKNSGSDKLTVNFKSWDSSDAKTINWYYNKTDSNRGNDLTTVGFASLADSNGDAINVFERQQINKSEYVVVGNEDTGCIFELKVVSNDTSTATNSDIEFENVFTGDRTAATITADGTGSIDLCTKTYTVDYVDDRNTENDEVVRLRYEDGSRGTANNAVIFPTIETSKGAKLMFYEPVTVNLSNWDGSAAQVNITKFKVPDGDGFTDIAITRDGTDGFGPVNQNYTVKFGTAANGDINTSGVAGTATGPDSIDGSIGQLTFNISRGTTTPNTAAATDGVVTVFLEDAGGTVIDQPAIVIFEEQDDSSGQNYEAIIVKIEGGGTTAASTGVSDVEFSWGGDAAFDEIQVQSDTDLYKSADFWGTIVTTDQSDSDSYTATISYPDEQVYAKLYFAEESAAITAGGSTGGTVTKLGSVVVSDDEVSTVSGKNLIVVGGSCINDEAANLLGGGFCGKNFEDATGVGSGSFLIETFSRSNDKVATLVAGYNAGDTGNAATYLITQNVDTGAGMKYVGSSATSASLV